MNFNLDVIGVTTKKGGRKRTVEVLYPGDPVMIMDRDPEEGSKSWKFRFNQEALSLLGVVPECEDDESKALSFIPGDAQSDESLHGRLFIADLGNELKLNKNWQTGKVIESASNKDVHTALNEKYDWIDTSQEDNVFLLTPVSEVNDKVIAEVLPYPENEEVRPDIDTLAQEAEDNMLQDW